jgi:hypothetical protein
VNVLVPYRPEPGRDRVYRWVRDRYESLGLTVIEGNAPEGEWRKAHAVADAASRATADVVLVADADVWSDGIDEALRAVALGAPWAIPHMHVRRLTQEATELVLNGGPLEGDLEEPAYRGVEGGGLVVLPLDTLRDIPPDARFAGWGGEDFAWSLALTTLAGPCWRGDAPLWHLHHPPQQDRRGMDFGKFGKPENYALVKTYNRANGDPERMRALVDEAKEALWQPSRSS